MDHPFGVPLLDGTSMTHPTDILVWLEETDTVMARGSPRLAYPIIPHDRLGEMWRTSVLESDLPDFLDMGDPELCLGMPGPQDCVLDVELVCDTALLSRRVSSRTLMSRAFLQGFTPVSPALLFREELPIREDWGWERAATSRSTSDWVTSLWVFCLSCDWVVGAAPTAGTSFILCSVLVVHHPVRDGLACCGTGWSDPGSPLPGTFRGFELNLQSDRLYDLDSDIPDVIGLRAIQPDAAVIKVMPISGNCCIRVVIPDDHLGTDGFHEILIHDMVEEEPPFVAMSDLGCLRLNWPRAIFSFLGRCRVDLEHLCHECRERFGSTQSVHSVASTFSKIWADMSPVITWI